MATYTGGASQVVAGTDVTSAWWNDAPYGLLNALSASWTAFTPTLSQGASTDIAATKACEYTQRGKEVKARYRLDVTAAGTASADVTLTLPVTASGTGQMIGTAAVSDANAVDWIGVAITATTTTFTIMIPDGKLGSAGSYTVASGDVLWALVEYEAA